MVYFSLFFQYFGLFSFIGCIVLLILVNKEIKKQLPTIEEKQEMIKKGIITGKEKKLVLRQKTIQYRYNKKFQEELRKAISKETLRQHSVNKKS